MDAVLATTPPGDSDAAATGGNAAVDGARGLSRVETLLRDEPQAFGFFQAVSLLHRIRSRRVAVGLFSDPADEVVRFSVPDSIAFPPSEIHALDIPDDDRALMRVNFMGLTGPQGLLPYHYTLLIADRNRVRDRAIGDFFDLFHHRMLSLFYRAWEKYRFQVAYERGDSDGLTQHLRDLVGVGLETDQRHLPVPDDALLFYTGVLGPQPRGAQGLEQMLTEHFDVPVRVVQFVGRWYPLRRHDQCELGDDWSPANQLGLGAVAGDEIWDAQTCFRVRIGPLSRSRYDAFLPGGRDHKTLRALARFYCHDQFDIELQLVLAKDDVPGLVLGADGPRPLGWCTWIRTGDLAVDADETILTL